MQGSTAVSAAEDVVDVSSPQTAPPDLAAAVEHDAALAAERKADERAADDKTFAPADAPYRYVIPADTSPGAAGRDMTPQQIESVQWVQGVMFDAGLPVEIGNGIATEADRAMKAAPNMTNAEAELAMRSCESELSKMWGKDKYAERIGHARRFISELEQKRPGLMTFLEDNPQIGNNPMIVMQIAMHAERHYARQKR